MHKELYAKKRQPVDHANPIVAACIRFLTLPAPRSPRHILPDLATFTLCEATHECYRTGKLMSSEPMQPSRRRSWSNCGFRRTLGCFVALLQPSCLAIRRLSSLAGDVTLELANDEILTFAQALF
jgi:hypothetical protein